jgi:heat shock protein HslJ
MKAWPLIVLIFAVGAAGCDENPVSPSEITDITWKLESVARVGSALVSVPNPEQYTVRFESNNRLSVRADCNTCTGTYTLDGSSLSIPPTMACTLIACPTPGLDTLFTSALSTVRTATVVENQLVLTGTEFTLRFRN